MVWTRTSIASAGWCAFLTSHWCRSCCRYWHSPPLLGAAGTPPAKPESRSSTLISRSNLLALLAVAVLVLAAGIWLSSRHHQTAPDKAIGQKVLPTLAATLNDVNEVHIVKAGEVTAVTLKRSNAADG